MKVPQLASAALIAVAVSAQQSAYGQSGGNPTTAHPSETSTASSWSPTTANPSETSTASSGSPTPSSGGSAGSGKTKFAGVNIAGFDFGCVSDGTCSISAIYPAPNAAGQMSHFVDDDNLNIFRLPVGWQYLVDNQLGGTLNANNMATYDKEVQSCLSTGAYCIIDIHNYARWDGKIIGQGGPTNDQFAGLWSQLATKYASDSRIIFGIMNEPHDIPDLTTWAGSVQAAVTAIRQAGATSQLILLPGTDYTSAAEFVSNGSLAALQTVKNLDGTTTNLIFDVHKYLDSDNSGSHAECVTDNVSSAFEPLAASLRSVGRQALLSETGGGNVASCEKYLCSEIKYLNENSDVYLGYVGWAAGGFDSTYVLTETPTQNGNSWHDTALVSACIARPNPLGAVPARKLSLIPTSGLMSIRSVPECLDALNVGGAATSRDHPLEGSSHQHPAVIEDGPAYEKNNGDWRRVPRIYKMRTNAISVAYVSERTRMATYDVIRLERSPLGAFDVAKPTTRDTQEAEALLISRHRRVDCLPNAKANLGTE
ncbi:MAG: hypothetical protein LQ340_001586 [Diploschistes diacapsis]|nr:MAG: hypothetical protein LQ340_001586 [Diploschistes diacapsis]